MINICEELPVVDTECSDECVHFEYWLSQYYCRKLKKYVSWKHDCPEYTETWG